MQPREIIMHLLECNLNKGLKYYQICLNFTEVTKPGVAKSKNQERKKTNSMGKVGRKRNDITQLTVTKMKRVYWSSNSIYQILTVKKSFQSFVKALCKDDSYQNTRDQRTRSTSNSQFCLVMHKSEDLTIQRRVMTGWTQYQIE